MLILKENNMDVPKDARTLKKTPTEVVSRTLGDGNYCHYGLENALTDFLITNSNQFNEIQLDFNIDGLPLAKSSTKQIWPILGNVVGYSDVFLIGVYEGYSKPKIQNEFMKEFVDETF